MTYMRLSGTDRLDGLGLSFRIPKKLRKLQPGKLLKKYGLPAALITGGLFIPGVLPAVAAGAKFAGRQGLRLLTRGARGAGRFARQDILPAAASIISSPTTTIQAPPVSSSVPFVPSGGGGGGSDSQADAADEGVTKASTEGGTPIGMLVVGGIVLAVLAGVASKKKRAA